MTYTGPPLHPTISGTGAAEHTWCADAVQAERERADLLEGERDAAYEMAQGLIDERDRLEAEKDALVAALTKLNELRDQIIRTQRASWASVVYPLVAILNEAGFESTVTDEELDKAPVGNRLDGAVQT